MSQIEKRLKWFKQAENPTDIQFNDFKLYLKRLDTFKMYNTEEEYRDVIPEGIFMQYCDSKVFGYNCDRSDLNIIYQILGTPFYKRNLYGESIFKHYHEDFDNITLDKLILLIKSFVVRFLDTPFHYPKIAHITTQILQRIPSEENNNINTNIPHKIILEPINLVFKLLNDTGCYNYQIDEMRGGWSNIMCVGGSMLSQLKKVLQCDITKIDDSDDSIFNLPYRVPYLGQKNDRYRVHITAKNQFVRLIKYSQFIFRYQPESDTLLLINIGGGLPI